VYKTLHFSPARHVPVSSPCCQTSRSRAADTPGPFGLASRDRTYAILQQAGWQDIQIQPLDLECAFPAAGLEGFFQRIGPLGQALPQADPEIRKRVLEAVRAAYAPFLQGQEVRFRAACWEVTAFCDAQSATGPGAGRC